MKRPVDRVKPETGESFLGEQHRSMTNSIRGTARRLAVSHPGLLRIPLEIRGRAVDARIARSEAQFAAVGTTSAVKKPLSGVRPLRILAAYPDGPWEDANLLPALSAFGEVKKFDLSGIRSGSEESFLEREELNRELREVLREGASGGTWDLLFAYASEWQLSPGTIRYAREVGCKTFCFSLDDKVSFESWREGQPSGIAGLVRHLDLTGTSSLGSIKKIVGSGGKALFFPEAASPELFSPRTPDEQFDVAFVGVAYGWRPWLVRRLTDAGLSVRTAGPGWPMGPIATAEMSDWVAKARVTIGIGGIGYSLRSTCLKGRDFELPMAGAVYLPQADDDLLRFCPELTAATWGSVEELVARVQELSREPQERRAAIRRRSAVEARRKHTWRHRIATMLAALELPDSTLDAESEEVHAWPPAEVHSSLSEKEAASEA